MLESLQDAFAPQSICFGCGPVNQQGLQLKSFVKGDEVVAFWKPKSFHEAFPGMLNGGIIGTLLDCHSNWAAAYYLMLQAGVKKPSCTVTANYKVKLLRPTQSDCEVQLVATKKELQADRAVIEAQLFSDNVLCATCEGLFVSVKPGHPAYHRW